MQTARCGSPNGGLPAGGRDRAPAQGPAQTTTARACCSPTPKTRLYRSISAAGPIALLGLSLSLTVGRPFAATALQTSENGERASPFASPRKSLVSNVPQPKLT